MNSEKVRQKTKEFYNQSAQSFSQTRNNWWEDLDFIKQYIPEKGKVLDLGCGNGRLIDFLKKNNFNGEYVGVDISKELIKIAKNKYPCQNFTVIESEEKLPIENDYFDVVLSIAVFHHCNPNLAVNALSEIERVTKSNGIIVITVWNLWQKKYLRFLLKNILSGKFSWLAEMTFKDNKKSYFRPCYWWTKKHLSKIIKKFGFKIIKSGVTYKNDKKRNIFFILKKNK